MILQAEDFPLKAIGSLIYARRYSSPVLTACDDALAGVIAAALNMQARSERPDLIFTDWLTIQ